MREVYLETPDVKWTEIGGLESVKRELQEAVEWPLKFQDLYKAIGYNMPKGVLLFGPSGTGKTLLAKAVATESEANFISVRGPELLSKWVGESERGVREVFRRARQAAPCIIFFDEIDSIAPTRGMDGGGMVAERVVSQLLTELDGIQALQGVVVLAATNRVDMVDPALLRSGRFDKIIAIPLPDDEARKQVLQIHMKGKPISKEVEVGELVKMTAGFNGADLASLVNTAVSIVLQAYIAKYPKPEDAKKHLTEAVVTYEHFQEAAKKVRSSRESKPMERVAVRASLRLDKPMLQAVPSEQELMTLRRRPATAVPGSRRYGMIQRLARALPQRIGQGVGAPIINLTPLVKNSSVRRLAMAGRPRPTNDSFWGRARASGGQ